MQQTRKPDRTTAVLLVAVCLFITGIILAPIYTGVQLYRGLSVQPAIVEFTFFALIFWVFGIALVVISTCFPEKYRSKMQERVERVLDFILGHY